MSIVDPARSVVVADTPSASSRSPVIASLAAHVLVVAALLVVPLFAGVRLPATPSGIGAFVMAAAVPEVPAPVASTPATTQAAPQAAARPASAPAGASTEASAAAPIVSPTGIAAGEPPPLPTGGGSLEGVTGAVAGIGTSALAAPPAPPAAPAAPSARPLRVGGDIRAPQKRHHVSPIYPSIAAQARITGTVIVEATISPSGDVVNVRVLRSVPLLDAAAVDAVRQWRYDPPTLNGQPVAVFLTVTVRFGQ